MRRILACLLLALGLQASQAGELNLTPLLMMVSVDGPPQPRYFFQDSTRRLGFRIDPKMTVNGAADSATFRFVDLRSATMRLRKSPAPIETPFDEKGIATYQSIARTLISSDATNIELVEQTPDAIAINGWKSAQFSYTYLLFGFNYHRSITFIEVSANEQLLLDIVAKHDEYKKAYARAYRVINSIYALPLVVKPGPT